MKRCSVCGADIWEDSRYCDQCGAPVPGACEGPPRDFWAERLAADTQKPKAAAEHSESVSVKPQNLPTPEPDPKRRWQILSAAVLFAVLVLAGILWFWRRPPDVQDPNLGTYYGVICTLEGTTLDAGADWVELRPKGKAQVSLMGSTQNGTWQFQGGDLTLDCGGQLMTGTLHQGVMQLQDGNLEYTLAKPQAMEQVPTLTEVPEDYTAWAGDYYGWWSIWSETEEKDDFWDVCGRITVEGSEGQVALWDTTCRKDEKLCTAEVEFVPGSTPKGRMRSQSGRFQNLELEPGAWNFDPGQTIVENLDGVVMILGDYGPGERYLIFLVPWGMPWDGVEQMEEQKKPYLDMLPSHYRDWYLPKIQEGKSMPDAFPKSFLREKLWD